MARRHPQPPATAEQVLTVHQRTCVACGQRLMLAHRTRRTVRRLDGVWRLTLTLHRCRNKQYRRYRLLCRPEEEGGWALPHGEFGFDVLALVGQLRSVHHRSIPDIHLAIRACGVVIAERTVTNLLARYDELVTLHLTDHERLRERLGVQGKVVLGLDGLRPDVGHEVLWVLRDCLSGEVLLARTLLSECAEVVELICEAKALLPVPSVGVISDGQQGIRKAVASALPNIPHQLCQFHSVREAARPIYEADRHAKATLKVHVRGVRPIEREAERALASLSAMSEREREQKEAAPQSGPTAVPTDDHADPATPSAHPPHATPHDAEGARVVQGYCLAIRSALTDDDMPPLCAAGLRLHDRLTHIAASLERAKEISGVGGAEWASWETWHLTHVQTLVQRGLATTAALWPVVRIAYAWVERAAQILENPEQHTAAEVYAQYTMLLAQLRAEVLAHTDLPALATLAATFEKVTTSYGKRIFVCYDQADLPQTKNDLEYCFGSVRYHERRASGRKLMAPGLLVRGTVRLHAAVGTHLGVPSAAELRPKDLAQWRQLRRRVEERQETRRAQRRFRQNPLTYLEALEVRLQGAACAIAPSISPTVAPSRA